MYVADSRATPAPSAAPAGRVVPGRRRAVAPTVLALGTVSLITDVSSEMVTAVLPLYLVAGLGLSPLGFGLLDGLYNGFSAVVRLAGGHLADRRRVGHKAVAVAGYGLSALCRPLLLVAGSLPLIGAVLAADRTGKGLRTAPRDAMISLASTEADRGRAFGVHRAMDTAGALMGPLVAFAVLAYSPEGYHAVFTLSSCVAVLGVLVLLLFVPGRSSSREDSPAGPAERPTLRAALALLRRPAVRRLAVCSALLGLATVSDSFVFLLLQTRLDLAGRWFALLPLGTAAGFLLLAVPLGRLADRVGRWRVFLGGHVALLAAYGVLLSSADAGWLPFAVLGLHGAFYAATDGVLMAAASQALPGRLLTSGLALVQTGQAGARFVCSLLFGAAWSAWGGPHALALFTVALAVAAGTAAVLRPARDTTAAGPGTYEKGARS
ncbi:MFS transporter [Streptomyces sp. NPDC003717]|uniref:MFS transporter n=1 Tax=Streptomyces sp. NPDC003717 TaxID=3154276 RepID=UPI0033A23054